MMPPGMMGITKVVLFYNPVAVEFGKKDFKLLGKKEH